MRVPILRSTVLAIACLLIVAPGEATRVGRAEPRQRMSPEIDWLGPPAAIADGVTLFRVDAVLALAADAAPRSLRLLRLDPRRVRVGAALATGVVPGRATVLDIARRTRALAAVNAGFFSPSGDPNGVLKIDGRLLSDTRRARGAVAIADGPAGVVTYFDRVSARVRLRFRRGGVWQTVPVDGVDTVRGRGRLVLYTPASGATTGTAGGMEWRLSGRPLRAAPPQRDGNAPIPPDGYVISYGGTTAPASLAGLTRAAAVQVRESLAVRSGQRPREWMRAPTLVGGAGLLLRAGRPLRDWLPEQLSAGFDTTSHPRTVIGRGRDGRLWLITADGRQPGRAVGLTFADLQVLLARLDLVDALNLDGGGSTTMVVRGEVVNRPSDLAGPRPVSDALVVHARTP